MPTEIVCRNNMNNLSFICTKPRYILECLHDVKDMLYAPYIKHGVISLSGSNRIIHVNDVCCTFKIRIIVGMHHGRPKVPKEQLLAKKAETFFCVQHAA